MQSTFRKGIYNIFLMLNLPYMHSIMPIVNQMVVFSRFKITINPLSIQWTSSSNLVTWVTSSA
jgi:hypothetical protein